jgi:hypothetical protein
MSGRVQSYEEEMKMSVHIMHVHSNRATQTSEHPQNFALSTKNGPTTFSPQFNTQDKQAKWSSLKEL